MLERQHHQAISKNPDYDRRHAVQQIGSVAHHKSNRTAAEFRQIDRTEKSDGNSQQTSKEEQFGTSDDGISHASTSLPDRGWQFGEEIPANGGAAVVDEVAENKKQHRDGHKRAQARHGQHEVTDKFAPTQTAAHACPISLPRCEVTTMSRRARPFKRNESRNRTNQSTITDCT